MTPSGVQEILNDRPLESGKVETGSYEVYGSNETFNINYTIHFSNVLVIYADGKASVIYAASPGDSWRHELAWQFSDLPSAE